MTEEEFERICDYVRSKVGPRRARLEKAGDIKGRLKKIKKMLQEKKPPEWIRKH
jgi:hypothetical protein